MPIGATEYTHYCPHSEDQRIERGEHTVLKRHHKWEIRFTNPVGNKYGAMFTWFNNRSPRNKGDIILTDIHHCPWCGENLDGEKK